MGQFSKITGAIAGMSLAACLWASPATAQKVTLDVLYAQPSFAKFHEPIAQVFM